MERVLSDSNKIRVAIQEEQSQVREKVKEYLNEQKQLANSLRQQLVELATEKTGKNNLDTIISSIRSMYQEKAKQLFATIHDFQRHLAVYQREQEEINRKLQRLVDRGESLTLEDLRQLEACKTYQDRKVDRELRRDEVERLLARFGQQRQESRRH